MTATFPGSPIPPPPGPPGPTRPPRPPQRPATDWLRRRLPGRTGNLVLVASVLAFGVLVDLAVQSPLGGWAITAAVAALAVGLIASGDVTNRSAQGLAITAVPVAGLTVLRASTWVGIPAVLTAATLLALAASMPDGAPLWRRRFTDLFLQWLGGAVALFLAPVRLTDAIAGLLPDRRTGRAATGPSTGASIARGLALAVPVVLLAGALLAAGDGVFASLVDLDLELETAGVHLAVILFGVWAGAAVFAHPRTTAPTEEPKRLVTLRPLESGIVLGGLAAVYALFAAAQVAVTLGGDAYVQETAGVTYAEYAREGFFPLLAAAALTALVLVALRSATDLSGVAGRRSFTTLGLVTVGLTLVLVQSAIARLGRYDDAFGLTMLRLSATAFAWWVGAVFVIIGAALLRPARRADWVPGAVLCSAIAALLLFGAVDPERQVVERNLARHAEVGRFDSWYSSTLSADAIPTLLANLDRLPESEAYWVRIRLCDRHRDQPWTPPGRRTAAALAEVCE